MNCFNFVPRASTQAAGDSEPKLDRTKKEHIATIERTIWGDAAQPVAILAGSDGHSVIIQEDAASFTKGQRYRFLGRWEEGKRGPQFRASTWVTEAPISERGSVKYLMDHCAGVGMVTAQKLVDKYGAEAIRTVRENPQQVATDRILPIEAARNAAEALARLSGLERTRVDLFGIFAGRGFPQKIVDAAISKWGARAPSIISANPFRLLVNRMAGCSWARCDKLYLNGGGNPSALKRQFLAGWNALREDRSGSTWVNADVVISAIREALPGPSCDPVKALKLGIRAGWLRVRRDGSRRWLAITPHAQAEQRIADGIKRLQLSRPAWPTNFPSSAAEGDGLPSGHQCEALRLATGGPVGCLVGGPGSGKTFTLSFLLRAIIEQHGEGAVSVAAPTNKAAVRATQLLEERGIDVKATSIHKLLEAGRGGHDGAGWGFARNADNPLEARFVIVDEGSMIDANLMASLLDACQAGTHILFVGDTFQLSPVSHGAPLRDFLASGSVGVGELTEIRRNAGSIVRACEAIKAGQPVTLPERFDFEAADPKNLTLHDIPIEEVLSAIEDTLRGMTKFDPVWDVQIITALNEKSEVSRRAINDRLARVLNPDGLRVTGCPFAVKDKIISLKNSQLKAVCRRSTGSKEDAENYLIGEREKEFISNGEQGKVVAVSAKNCVMEFSGSRLVSVPTGRARSDDAEEGAKASGGISDFDLAYGLTVHKSQGSEWPIVIAIMDAAGSGVADRSFWYTAISRAKYAGMLLGDRKAFVAQCTRQNLAKRKTFLVELLVGDSAASL